jgi:hypothetical protein
MPLFFVEYTYNVALIQRPGVDNPFPEILYISNLFVLYRFYDLKRNLAWLVHQAMTSGTQFWSLGSCSARSNV